MKKIITAIIFTLALNVCEAQDTVTSKVAVVQHDADSRILDTTALTAREVYTDAKEGIAGLAKALKAPAEHVYTILVRQQVVKAVIYIIAAVFLLIAIGLAYFRWTPALFASAKTSDESFAQWLSMAVIWCILIGCIISIATHVEDIAIGFINPEYGAIKDIFEFVKGGKP